MPPTLTIVRQRRHRRQAVQRSGQRRGQRAVLAVGFIVSALLLVLLVAAGLAYASLTRGLPSIEELNILLNPQDGLLLQPTRLYDRSGAHLLEALAPSPGPRSYVPYSQIPKSLVDATLALADPVFWQEPGFVLAGWQEPQTHPTLAQKLVSDLLLWDEPPSISRAIRERLLAAQVTARFGREKVLELYLNSADYGHYAYGIDAAARLYFGKSAAQLNLSEAVLLAAVGQAPALNPMDAPQAAEAMRRETLQYMQKVGLITPDQAAQALANPPKILPYTAPASAAPAFVALALDQLSQRFDRTRIERGGLDILTTLDYNLQLQTECALKTQMARLGGNSRVIPAANGSACDASRLLPTLPSDLTLGASSESAVLLDPQSGQVLAEVGDMRAGQAGTTLVSHPAGTLITPFIYLTGFTRGLNPGSLEWDIPAAAPDPAVTYHGPVRLRIALANDYLAPAVHVLDQMGADLSVPSPPRLDWKSRSQPTCSRTIFPSRRWLSLESTASSRMRE